METKRTKVFIVDDYPTIAQFLRILIGWEKDFVVCGDASHACQALEMLPSLAPDLILLDLVLPDRHGLEVIRDIRVVDPTVRILVLSAHDEVLFAERSLEVGAQGYVMKSESSSTWLEAMRLVVAGYTYLSPVMRMRVTQRWGSRKCYGDARGIDRLSDRELEVFQLLGEGRSIGEISAVLSVERHTVESYQTRLRDKLDLRNTHELARYATAWFVTTVPSSHRDFGLPITDGSRPPPGCGVG